MNSKLAAFAIGRRSIAIALFSGQEMECFEVRSIPNDEEKAKAAAAAFVRRTLEHLHFPTAAVQGGKLDTSRKEHFRNVICETLREQGVPVLETSEAQLFDAFRNPPIVRRGDFRKIASFIFPQLLNSRSNHPLSDAVGLGLYLQTERILKINNHNE